MLGKNLKAALICKESHSMLSAPKHRADQPPQHGGTADARAAATLSEANDTSDWYTLMCASSQWLLRGNLHDYLSLSAKKIRASHGLLASPCPFLRKYISHGINVCMVYRQALQPQH